MNDARTHLAGLLERDEPPPSLGEVALWVAAEEYPELDVPACMARIDALAERVERLLARLQVSGHEALRAALAEEQGYHGNRDNYYEPRNSYLSDVIERRGGIPISLSILYVEVARRSGMAAEGHNFDWVLAPDESFSGQLRLKAHPDTGAMIMQFIEGRVDGDRLVMDIRFGVPGDAETNCQAEDVTLALGGTGDPTTR